MEVFDRFISNLVYLSIIIIFHTLASECVLPSNTHPYMAL